MNRKYFLLSLIVLFSINTALAQVTVETELTDFLDDIPETDGEEFTLEVGTPPADGTGNTCFDHYHFGSVDFADFRTERSEYNSGEEITFFTNVTNTNEYPLVEGSVLVQVFRENTEYGSLQGDDLVDEFFVLDNLHIPNGESFPLEFTWKIPTDASSGNYKVATFFVTNKKYNLSGLSFLSNVYGGLTFTKINGTTGDIKFNRDNLLLNTEKQTLRAFAPEFEPETPIEYVVELVNNSDSAQTGQINAELYEWDGLLEENKRNTVLESFDLQSGESHLMTVTFEDLPSAAYHIKFIATSGEQKSVLISRFTVRGENGRLIFAAVDNFPLKEGEKANLFTCFSNSSDYVTEFEGTITADFIVDGQIIATTEFTGTITPNLGLSLNEFTATQDIKEATVDAKIVDDNGNLMDHVISTYNYNEFYNTAQAKVEFNEETGSIEIALTDKKFNEPIEKNIHAVITDKYGLIKWEKTIEDSAGLLDNIELPAGEYTLNVEGDNKEFKTEEKIVVSLKEEEIKNSDDKSSTDAVDDTPYTDTIAPPITDSGSELPIVPIGIGVVGIALIASYLIFFRGK